MSEVTYGPSENQLLPTLCPLSVPSLQRSVQVVPGCAASWPASTLQMDGDMPRSITRSSFLLYMCIHMSMNMDAQTEDT